MPSICSVGLAPRWDCSTRRMISSFSGAEYLFLAFPHPRSSFFEKPVLQQLLCQCLLQIVRLGTQCLNLVRTGLSGRVAGKTLLADLKEFLRPVIIQALGNTLATARRRDAFLTAQSFKDNADLLFG